jgi:hypothetical protein
LLTFFQEGRNLEKTPALSLPAVGNKLIVLHAYFLRLSFDSCFSFASINIPEGYDYFFFILSFFAYLLGYELKPQHLILLSHSSP